MKSSLLWAMEDKLSEYIFTILTSDLSYDRSFQIIKFRHFCDPSQKWSRQKVFL